METKNQFSSIEKLMELSRYQVLNTPKASFMGKIYNASKYVEREDLKNSFEMFFQLPQQKMYLLLGEAGFGKTWGSPIRLAFLKWGAEPGVFGLKICRICPADQDCL